MNQKFEIPIRFESFNSYLNMAEKSIPTRKYFPRRKYKREVQETIEWAIKAARIKRVTKPCIITFVWYESRHGKQKSRDKDNISYAKKFILDALQERKILPNDNDNWVQGFADYFIYGQGQKVEVRIDEVNRVEIEEAIDKNT